jgi:hypothetical protein
MSRFVPLVMGLAAGAAVATTWVDVMDSPSGRWAVQPTSRAVLSIAGQNHRTARVQLVRADGAGQVFLAAVPVQHCNQARGDLLLLNLQGQVHSRDVFAANSGTVGAVLARELCKTP